MVTKNIRFYKIPKRENRYGDMIWCFQGHLPIHTPCGLATKRVKQVKPTLNLRNKIWHSVLMRKIERLGKVKCRKYCIHQENKSLSIVFF